MAKDKKAAKELTMEEKLAQAFVPVEEQPYKIPENWCWTTIDKVTYHISDGSHNPPINSEKGIPLLSAANIHNGIIDFESANRWITEKDWEYANKRTKIELNDVLVTIVATIGRVAIVKSNKKFALQRSVAVLKPIINSDFLAYYLESPFVQSFMTNNAKGTAQKGFYLKTLAQMPCIIAPTTEQQCIVDHIKSIFAKLDEAKEKAQAVVDSFELRKSAILHKAFTGELTKQWRDEHGLTLESWKKTKLGDTIRLLSGQDFKPEQYNNKNDGVPYITGASNFDETHVVINRWTSVPSVIAKKGDILLVCKGSGYGKTIIADFEEAHIARQIMAIRTNDNIINEYLLFYFQAQYEYFRNNGKGLIPGISRKVVLEMQVRLPTKNEQVYIVEQVKSILNKEILAREAAKKVIDQINIIKQAVLTRAFHGELGTNDPTEEAAIELLKLAL